MRKMTLSLVFALGIMTVSFAQNGSELTSKDIAEIQTTKMTENYSLSDGQQDKIHAINLETANKLDDVREDKFGAQEIRRSEILEEQRNKISAILTDQQRAEFEEDNREYDAKRASKR